LSIYTRTTGYMIPGINSVTPTGDSVVADDIQVHIHDPSNPQNIRPMINGKHTKMEIDTVSKDSDSLIAESPDEDSDGFDPTMPWWKHPKVRENWKMVLAALALFFIGLGLSVAGMVIMFLPINGLQGIVFFIAGIICFIPGAYHVVYIYFAVKGKRGFDFSFLPLFN